MLLAQQGLRCQCFWTLLSKTDKLLDSWFRLRFLPTTVRKHWREAAAVCLGFLPQDTAQHWPLAPSRRFPLLHRGPTQCGPKFFPSEGRPLRLSHNRAPPPPPPSPGRRRLQRGMWTWFSEMGRDRSRLGHQEGPLTTLLVTPGDRLQGRVLALSPLSFLVLINSTSSKAILWVCPRPRGSVPDAPVFIYDNSTFHKGRC